MATEITADQKVALAQSVLGVVATRTAATVTGRTPSEEFKAIYKDVLYMVQNYIPGNSQPDPTDGTNG